MVQVSRVSYCHWTRRMINDARHWTEGLLAVGLETMGNKLDAWMKEQLGLDTGGWQEVCRYRAAYRNFR